MLDALRQWYRNRPAHPYVRPWGLAAPILVLLVCLPLLRPLRHDEMSENERYRLATVEAIVEHGGLAIEGTSFYRGGTARGGEPGLGTRHSARFSPLPPVLSALLAGPYWVMHRFGLTFQSNPALSIYLLTLVGVTLPVAGAAGLVYRMGRLFELRRPWRTTLAIAAVFGSGLVSYATVLNSHAPAAAFVLASCAALFHAGVSRRQGHAIAWAGLGGFFAALAGVIDLGALVFLFLLIGVILAMRWSPAARAGGVACYLLMALPPLALHAALTIPVTGDIRPGFLHAQGSGFGVQGAESPSVNGEPQAPDLSPESSAGRIADGLFGSHGLLSHFPILLIGLGGIAVVFRRHWPHPAKTLAIATLAGAGMIMAAYVTLAADWGQPMFAVRWFIVFLPLVIFWGGAWLRKSHHPATWAGAGVLLVFSILTTLLGATSPFTPARPGEYTAYTAARQLFRSSSGTPVVEVAAAK